MDNLPLFCRACQPTADCFYSYPKTCSSNQCLCLGNDNQVHQLPIYAIPFGQKCIFTNSLQCTAIAGPASINLPSDCPFGYTSNAGCKTNTDTCGTVVYASCQSGDYYAFFSDGSTATYDCSESANHAFSCNVHQSSSCFPADAVVCACMQPSGGNTRMRHAVPNQPCPNLPPLPPLLIGAGDAG